MKAPTSKRVLGFLFGVFGLSGFSGLVYESIWSHYMRLLLGHSAYAQTLVLAIFMGGMAAGAFGCSRYLKRYHAPLLTYVVVEAVIGTLGIGFHAAYTGVTEQLYNVVVPAIATPGLVEALKWLTATALILPQSLLLGATFPLMSTAIIRLAPERTGRTLGMLYFTNSIGAAIGAIVSIFVLVPTFGLPGAVTIAGLVNLVIAGAIWPLARRRGDTDVAIERTVSPDSDQAPTAVAGLLILGAFSTGLTSFVYEIAWIRMLTMVLGATTQAFELMLSAFITGLALGGLWVRRHLDGQRSGLRMAGHIQVIMGLLAVATIPMYAYSFHLMDFLMEALGRTGEGYVLFNISSHAIAMAVMLPTTFMAGMTLPLFTYSLVRFGGGERSIGRIYAANTLGAIAGVLLAVHVLMPRLGTEGMIAIAAWGDVSVGLGFLWFAGRELRRYEGLGTICTAAAVIAAVAIGVSVDPVKKASAVYRSGLGNTAQSEVLYAQDGKTASIHVLRSADGTRSVTTNGKPEAGIQMHGPPYGADMSTMALAAAVPMALHPNAEKVANIGLGSGITTDTLLANDRFERVDTIEIERAMVEAARYFRHLVDRVFEDPRSRIHIADAKTFFSRHQRQYDLIISEPSNPWVSGVASLFTRQFYERINRHLAPDGILVQWLQLYETNMRQVASVVGALSEQFEHYAFYNTDNSNILIVASRKRSVTDLDGWLFKNSTIRQAVQRGEAGSVADLGVRLVGTQRTLSHLTTVAPAPVNSDYFPYLSLEAPKSRFLDQSATALTELNASMTPIKDVLDTLPSGGWSAADLTASQYYAPAAQAVRADAIARTMIEPDQPFDLSAGPGMTARLELIRARLTACGAEQPMSDQLALSLMFDLAQWTTPYLRGERLTRMWEAIRRSECFDAYSDHVEDWAAFHQAVGSRRPTEIRVAAEQLRSRDRFASGPRDWQAYLLGNQLMAALAQEDLASARRIIRESRSLLGSSASWSLAMRLMAARAAVARP